MTQPVLNQDPIQIVTWRVLPSGEVEALLRLSKRDMALVEDRGARYSIEPNPQRYMVDGISLDGLTLDGGPVGEAAEMGKDIERMVGFGDRDVSVRFKRVPLTDEQARAFYETHPPPPERCDAWVTGSDGRMRCDKVKGHDTFSSHAYVRVDGED